MKMIKRFSILAFMYFMFPVIFFMTGGFTKEIYSQIKKMKL